MPPSMTSAAAADCLNFLVDGVLEMKHRHLLPFIAISGNFNRFDVARARFWAGSSELRVIKQDEFFPLLCLNYMLITNMTTRKKSILHILVHL